MIFSLTLVLGYLTGNLREEELYRMQSNLQGEEQPRKLNGKLAVGSHPAKNGRLPNFIHDKLSVFKLGTSLSAWRRRLHESQSEVHSLRQQCQALCQEVASSKKEISTIMETKMRELTESHTKKLAEATIARQFLQGKLDTVLRDSDTLHGAMARVAKQLKEATAQLKLQGSVKGALHGKLIQAERQRDSLQSKLEALESKHADLEKQRSEEKAAYETRLQQQQTAFDTKYASQNATFDTKYKEQKEAMDRRNGENQKTTQAAYRSQDALYRSKCSDLKASLDEKLNREKEDLAARLRDEKTKREEVVEQKEALMKRLDTTEMALVKSRQVKVNQEYQFTDTVNSLVPKGEMVAKQEECVLYKKIVSVFAALILVLMAVVFVGLRFLFN